MKSERSSWSWQNQLDCGDAVEGWDGARNYQASNYMKLMEIGDLVFFYHSVHKNRLSALPRFATIMIPTPPLCLAVLAWHPSVQLKTWTSP